VKKERKKVKNKIFSQWPQPMKRTEMSGTETFNNTFIQYLQAKQQLWPVR